MKSRQPTAVRRKQIADAALEIIAHHGLNGFTTLALAQHVGIAEGTIFRHFRSKREVVLAAIGRIEEAMFSEQPGPSGDPLEDLGRFFRRRMRIMGASPGMARLFFSEELARAAGQEGEQQVQQMQRRSLDFMRSCLESAHDKGLTRQGTTPELLLVIVHGAALALVHGAMLGATEEALPARAERIWQGIEPLLRR